MIVAFRHGHFALNARSRLTGEAAFRAMEEEIPPDADATMDLLPEGRAQGDRLRRALANFSIYACLRSPPLRTKTTAELVLAGRDLPGGTLIVPDARERSRGIYSYVPEAWAYTTLHYPFDRSISDWQPHGIDYNGNPGESIRAVRDNRVAPVLRIADKVSPSGETTAVSTHRDWMVALRAYYLGFDDERFGLPLIPDPPENNRALTTAHGVINGQADLYDCTCPEPVPAGSPERHMDVFRTIITEPGLEFDTGWLPIREM